MIKVIVALSGGVDSSFAAWLLIQKGYMVEGVCLDLFGGSEAPERALDVGERLGIRVHILDRKQRFQEEIIDDFCRSYHAGLTPNPCAACNPLIKFGSLLEFAAEHGAEKIATGHYARCIQDQDTGIHNLYKGLDARKDQSYFLYHLDQEVLQKTIFPLGESTKTEVRAAAAIAGLPMAAAKDSQEICFIPDGDYIGFLRRRANGADKAGGLISDGLILDDLIPSGLTSDGLIPSKLIPSGLIPGDFIDEEGHILGRHQGLACYTIGQRKNLGVSFGSRMFVLAIDPETNRVVVGSNDDLFTRNVMTDSNYFTDGALRTQPFAAEVKLRSGATPAKAMFHPLERGRGKLVFEADQRAVTPGQCAVYYHGDKVLGGGIIQR